MYKVYIYTCIFTIIDTIAKGGPECNNGAMEVVEDREVDKDIGFVTIV